MPMFNRGKYMFQVGQLVWDTTDVRALLVKSGYSFDPDQDVVADLSSHELTHASYVRKSVTGRTATEDDVNDRVVLDADDVTWTSLDGGETIEGVVLYKYHASDGSANLIAFFPVTPFETNGSDYTITWNSVGVITVS